MNKYKKLLNNSFIFTIGSFGSNIISFLMVPLYTHLLSTSEYGVVDLMNTTVSLLIPIFTLELGQAALRFSVETKNEIEQNKIFSNISAYALVVSLIVLIVLPLLDYFNLFGNYLVMFSILLILRIVNTMYSQYIRGIGLVKEFALNGILMTLVTVISNVILLVILNYRVEGYILSLILAALFSNFYLFYSSYGITRIRMFNPEWSLFKDMLRFSIPIVPNAAMWWIINSSTRYFVLYFIGSAGNGVFAVANKIPALISMATGIFSQAWQLSSFEEYNSDTKNNFYSKTFNIYWLFIFIASSAILVILKPLMSILVEDSFFESWQVAPLLMFAVIYQSFSTFLGTNYTAAKETKGAFLTSIYAGVVSLLSSIILIPILGLIGAGLSTAISLVVLFFIRLIDTRKYVMISINNKLFIYSNIIYIAQIIILFLTEGLILFGLELILFILLLFGNKKTLIALSKVIIKFVKKNLQ